MTNKEIENIDPHKTPILTDAEPGNNLTLHYEFLPCPFCGGKVYLVEPGFNIVCKKDDCDYIYGLSLTMAEDEELSVATKLRLLSERWNKRVTLD